MVFNKIISQSLYLTFINKFNKQKNKAFRNETQHFNYRRIEIK